MIKMNNRVYGVVGIKSIMSNWNADFTGRCKTLSDGTIYGSDKAFKYPIKQMWKVNNEKVLYAKSYIIEKGINKPKDISERYNEIFDTDLSKEKDEKSIIVNLFSALDVLNFGATFAVAKPKTNISITGAVQIGQGFNKYDSTSIEVQNIISPFRNKENDEMTTIGNKVVADEAHYMYPFSVNPSNYDIYTDVYPEFIGYTKEAYSKFKEACLVAATSYNTNSKIGCENEFAVFVECKDNSKLYLANLDSYIEFKKEDEKDIIDITTLMDMLSNHLAEIDNIEIYYNEYTTTLVGANDNCIIKSLF